MEAAGRKLRVKAIPVGGPSSYLPGREQSTQFVGTASKLRLTWVQVSGSRMRLKQPGCETCALQAGRS